MLGKMNKKSALINKSRNIPLTEICRTLFLNNNQILMLFMCLFCFFQVGTNLVNVKINKRKELTVRELGGAMAPIWSSYYSDTSIIIVSWNLNFSN